MNVSVGDRVKLTCNLSGSVRKGDVGTVVFIRNTPFVLFDLFNQNTMDADTLISKLNEIDGDEKKSIECHLAGTWCVFEGEYELC